MYMSGQSHTGDWAVEASVSDTCATPSWGAYLERAFDYDSDTLYARTWFMLMDDNNFSGVPGRGFEFMRLCDSQMETVCSFEIAYFDLSTMMFVAYLTNGPGGLETVTRNYGVGMGTGIWYYLEVAVVRDSISGSFTVWLGEEGEDPWMIPYTGVDNLTGIDLDNFCVGIVDTGGDATGSMRFDDYALSTSRIGSGS
jgi:hypothetical protein